MAGKQDRGIGVAFWRRVSTSTAAAPVEDLSQYRYTRDYTAWVRCGRPGGRFPYRKYGINWLQAVAIRAYVLARLRAEEKR